MPKGLVMEVLEFDMFVFLLWKIVLHCEKFFKMKVGNTELISYSVTWLIATLQNCHKNLATKSSINSSLSTSQIIKGSGMKRFFTHSLSFTTPCSLYPLRFCKDVLLPSSYCTSLKYNFTLRWLAFDLVNFTLFSKW